MNESTISVRYAKALFLSSKDAGNLDAVYADVKFIYQCLHEVPEFPVLLDNPAVSQSKKKNSFLEIFTSQIEKLSLDFLLLIIENKREQYIAGICRYFFELYKQEKNIKSVVLSTVKKVSDEAREKLKNELGEYYQKDIELSENIDEKLIGGFVLRIDDYQIDASVVSSLKKIRKELIETII